MTDFSLFFKIKLRPSKMENQPSKTEEQLKSFMFVTTRSPPQLVILGWWKNKYSGKG